MKKIVLICVFPAAAIVVFLILLLSEGLPYTREVFENQISKEYNNASKIKILNEKETGDIKVIIFDKDDNIGKCVLLKNFFGRYSIFEIACGDSRQYRSSIDKISGKYYFILLGKNTDYLDRAVVHIYGLDGEDRPFELNKEVKIPEDEYYIVVEEMDNAKNYNNNFSDSTMFYDKNGNDITRLFYR